MKRIHIFLLLIFTSMISIAQTVAIGKDACSQCNMIIRDSQFMSYAVYNNGETKHFDAIECLVNFLKDKKEDDFRELLVVDYSRPDNWLEAKKAVFLKSKSIPSPMGAYLSAYPDAATLDRVRKQKGGDAYNWTELKAQFEQSNFGLLNHPDHHHDRPDAYAPLGIMGDHVHHKGSFMVSLRYMSMQMEGNLQGNNPISNSEIFENYMAAPQAMNMHMYMVGAMYGLTDQLTIMVMQMFNANVMQMERSHQNAMMGMQPGSQMVMNYETKSTGFGDTQVSILYSLLANEKASLHLNAGVSLPNGKTSKSDDMPMGEDMKLPYAMQLGSGTVDLILGTTMKQSFQKTSLGLQPNVIIRTGENDQGYRLGNCYKLNAWIGHGLSNWLSVSARVEGAIQKDMVGVDDDLNPMMAPPANVTNYGFECARVFSGANLSFSNSQLLQRMKVGMEAGLPVYQNVEGIQMKEGLTYNLGIRYLL